MKSKIIKYSLTVFFSLVLAFVVLCFKKIFSLTERAAVFGVLSDGFFVSGAVTLCVGGLIFVGNQGGFDMLGFGIRKFFGLFRRNLKNEKFKTYYEYKEYKKDNKNEFLYLVIIGAVFILIGLLFIILYENSL